jgi:hypothetical protein
MICEYLLSKSAWKNWVKLKYVDLLLYFEKVDENWKVETEKWYELKLMLPYGGAEKNKLELRVIITESSRETLEEIEIAHCVVMKICVQSWRREEEKKRQL